MRISGGIGGPPPGMMMMAEDDDQDDDGVPPEILDMIRMTEMMASRSGFGGMPGMQLRRVGAPKKEKEDNTPRHEEPIEDIMARMNKLSDEIGDRHDKKYTRVESKSQRVVQIMVAVGVLLMIMLVSFIMTCRASAQKDIDEDNAVEKPRATQKAD